MTFIVLPWIQHRCFCCIIVLFRLLKRQSSLHIRIKVSHSYRPSRSVCYNLGVFPLVGQSRLSSKTVKCSIPLSGRNLLQRSCLQREDVEFFFKLMLSWLEQHCCIFSRPVRTVLDSPRSAAIAAEGRESCPHAGGRHLLTRHRAEGDPVQEQRLRHRAVHPRLLVQEWVQFSPHPTWPVATRCITNKSLL